MSPTDRIVADLQRERWAPLPAAGEFRGVASIYWVSTLGRVAWVAPSAPAGKGAGLKSARLDRRPGKAHHLRVQLKLAGDSGPGKTARVHRMVAAAWGLGPSHLIRHLDGDGTNNRVENLAPGTEGDNLRDQYLHGTRTSETARRAARARWGLCA